MNICKKRAAVNPLFNIHERHHHWQVTYEQCVMSYIKTLPAQAHTYHRSYLSKLCSTIIYKALVQVFAHSSFMLNVLIIQLHYFTILNCTLETSEKYNVRILNNMLYIIHCCALK